MSVRRLLILLLLPALAFAQQGFYGTRISTVRLSNSADSSDQTTVPLQAGETLTPENLRAAIAALYETGRYQYVEVDAAAAPDGTALTFNVRPHFFFSTVRLEPDNLLQRPISGLLRIPVGEKFSTARVSQLMEQTVEILEEAGYFNAVLAPEYQFHEATRLVTVILRAAVKPPARVSTIQLHGGEDTFQADELRRALDLSEGKVFTRDGLERGTAAIRQKFSDLGFLNTRINVAPAYNASSNTVALDIGIEPGQFTLVAVPGASVDLSRQELRELVPIFEEGTYDSDLIREGRARIVEYLQRQGYFEVAVGEPEVHQAPLDNAVQINFHVEPGERYRVRDVVVRGNSFFKDDQIKPRLKIRPAGLFDHGSFSPELLASDVGVIQNMYRRAGFENVQVQGHKDQASQQEVDVTFDIEEGPRYPISAIIFSGNVELEEGDLRKGIGIKEGDIYTPAGAEQARSALMELYYAEGFPEIRVDDIQERADDGSVRVTFQVTEGRHYEIGEIIVAGNTRTAEKIVHRNSGLFPNIPYNPESILAAQQRLYALGLFNRVEIVPLDEATGEKRSLLIQLEEAKPIVVTPGVGVKEYAGPRVTLDVSHNNLFGLDRALSFRLRYGQRERQFQTTYREPRLFNHDLEGYGTLSFEKKNLPFFEASSADFSIQILKRLSAYRNFLLTASYQTVNLQDIKFNTIIRRFPDLKGVIQIARIGASFVGDWRDDAINPQRGTLQRFGTEVASRELGSEVNFITASHQSNYYQQVPYGVLAFSGSLGWKIPYGGDHELPISERYFAGGSTTLRGYDLDEAGPLGGGQLMTIGNVEYRVPFTALPIGGIGGALFYDTGNVFERSSDFSLRDFTHSAGAGLRYQTPIGPVRFDVGFNLRPKLLVSPDGDVRREERVQVFFTLGHTF